MQKSLSLGPVASLGHGSQPKMVLRGGTWFRSIPIVAVVFLILTALIALNSYSPAVREALAILGSVALELLISLAALNFTGWLFVHASYHERVRQAEANEMAELRDGLRRLAGQAERLRRRQQRLTDRTLDRWIGYISRRYSKISERNSKLTSARNYFLWGLIIAIVGGMTELAPPLSGSNDDVLALIISTALLVIAVLTTNSLMKDV
jgi:hypothetical protein